MVNVSKIIDNGVKDVGLEHTPLHSLNFTTNMSADNLRTALFLNLENRVCNCAFHLLMRIRL